MHYELDFSTWDTPDQLHETSTLYIQRGKDGYSKREDSISDAVFSYLRSESKVVPLDVPSGLNSSTGESNSLINPIATMTIAFMKHCFRRNLEVTGMSLFPQGVTLAYENMRAAAKHTFNEALPEGGFSEVKVEAKEYKNWVFLGAQPGG